jgi:molybdopterin molybdotransferase
VAQLSDDCFAFGGKLLTIDAALRLIAAEVPCVEGVEQVSLHDADGRVLAEDVMATVDLPPFDNAAVDGYAVRLADLERFRWMVASRPGRRSPGRSRLQPPGVFSLARHYRRARTQSSCRKMCVLTTWGFTSRPA